MTIDALMGQNLKNLDIIRKFSEKEDRKWQEHGPFTWTDEPWGLKEGVYQPIGRLQLPMNVALPSDDNEFIIWTVFAEQYFIGEPISFPDGGSRVFQLGAFEENEYENIRTANSSSLIGIKRHVGDYFNVLGQVLNGTYKPGSEKHEEEAKKMILSCFTEYKT